jgi:hypothetical protein
MNTQLAPSPYFIDNPPLKRDFRGYDMFNKSRRIKKAEIPFYSVYKRGRNSQEVPISLNFTDREDAEMLICELAEGKISEKEARRQSDEENKIFSQSSK